jgi:hypothetical protein
VRSIALPLLSRRELSDIELYRYTERNPRHYDPPEVTRLDNADYLYSVLGGEGRIRYISRSGLLVAAGANYPVPNVSLMVQNAHQCFGRHVGIRLSPVLFMDIIVRELAQVIRSSPSKYAHLFTTRPDEKVTIRIRNDEVFANPAAWKDALESFYLPLREAITDSTFDLFAPRFSTLTEEDGIAQLVALMDAASPFYDYRVNTMCGIPLIELDGDAADWALLVEHAEQLAFLFPDLSRYFQELMPVLREIAGTAATDDWDEEFWRSLYKWKEDSNGEFADGWINVFFAHAYGRDGAALKSERDFGWRRSVGNPYSGGTRLDHFPSGISQVPFTWELRGAAGNRDVPMLFVAGALGIDQTLTSTLEARLGFAVVDA